MSMVFYTAIGLLIAVVSAQAQIVQFSGAPPAGGAAFEFLAQKFSGAPIEVWGTKKQNSSYAGNALRVQRNDNNVTTDIPFTNGKDASVSAFNTACNGTTCLLNILYGQMGVSDCVQGTKANMPQVLVHTDGLLAIQGATGKYCQATAGALKVATAHVFGVFYPGYVNDTKIDFYTFWAYSGTNFTAARYGFLLNPNDSYAQVVQQNGAANNGTRYTQFAFANAHLGDFHVWDVMHNTGIIKHDARALPVPGEASTTITYPSTTGLVIGKTPTDTDDFLGKWRALALYDTARADRDSISNFLVSDFGITKLPLTTTDSLGITYTPQYAPCWSCTDTVNGIEWWQEHGGYPWSLWFGSPSNAGSGVSVKRFEVRPNDSDTMVNQMERAEQGGLLGGVNLAPTDMDIDFTAQFLLEPGPSQTGDWADIFQWHYGGGEVVGSPDLFYIGLLNETFNFATTADGNHTIHATQAIVRNQWYAIRVLAHLSANRTTDSLKIWFGQNGTTLPQIVNVTTGTIWNTGTAWDGFFKNGIYRGFPNTNSGSLALVVANYRASYTAGAFASFVTTQLALPTP